jgi:hypothetical protein
MVPRHGGLAARSDPCVEDYAAHLASRLLGSLEQPPKAANVYSLPTTSFRFEWLVVW